MNRILYLFIILVLFSCKENKKIMQQLVFSQPESITLDTTLAYFTFIKKYIQEDKKNLSKTNYYIMSIYGDDDNGLRIKFLSSKHSYSFNGRMPYHYFRYEEDTIFVFTGLDMITKIDKSYNKKIENMFTDNTVIVYDPPCWEIVFNKDTCYYKQTSYPFIPMVDGLKFTRPLN